MNFLKAPGYRTKLNLKKSFYAVVTLMTIILVSGILLTACQKADTSKEPSLDPPISEPPSPDPVEAFSQSPITPLTDYVSEEELALAYPWNTSDNAALAFVMKKALSGEDLTIACIGGSITQGTVSTGISDSQVGFKKGYADLFFQWWSDTFPETDFTFINAGIGATDSYLGVHRVQKDVLDYHPDLVLVEFSVNDGSSVIDKRNYDNLVRRILLSESRPAVMLLFMGQTNGSTAQDIHSLIGFNYKLPMISYINVIHHMMNENLYTEQQLSGDTVHPSAMGHAIAGEILWKYLNDVYTVKDSFSEPEAFNSKAVTFDVYLDSEILDGTSLSLIDMGTFTESSVFSFFPNDYSCTEGAGNLSFTVNCKRLGLLYFCTADGKSGQFDVYVDGEYAAALNADASGGWGNYAAAKEVFVSDECSEHIVTLKKAENSTGDCFTLLGVLASY